MFNQKTKNAIRIVSLLVNNQEDKKFGAIEIADKLELKSPFISKILQELAKNNIISSSKGRGGGFYLNEENRKKNILDIVDVFEDHEKIYECILGLPDCSDQNPCILHSIYRDFKTEIGVFLNKNIDKIITNESENS